MKAIKDQVRQQLGPQYTVSDAELNRAYRRYVRNNGPDRHPFYTACTIADYLKINGRVQRVVLGKLAGVALAFEAKGRSC